MTDRVRNSQANTKLTPHRDKGRKYVKLSFEINTGGPHRLTHIRNTSALNRVPDPKASIIVLGQVWAEL